MIQTIPTEHGTARRLADGRKLVPFDIDAAARRRGIAFSEVSKIFHVPMHVLRRLRDMEYATIEMREYFTDPKYYEIPVTPYNGPTVTYRAYRYTDQHGKRYVKLWNAPGRPTWNVRTDDDGRCVCNCPSFTDGVTDDYRYKCKHIRAVLTAKLLVETVNPVAKLSEKMDPSELIQDYYYD